MDDKQLLELQMWVMGRISTLSKRKELYDVIKEVQELRAEVKQLKSSSPDYEEYEIVQKVLDENLPKVVIEDAD